MLRFATRSVRIIEQNYCRSLLHSKISIDDVGGVKNNGKGIRSVKRQHDTAIAKNGNLINRGDFRGVRPGMEREKVNVAPEIIISKLQHQAQNNLRISGENFLQNILIPLEEEAGDVIRVVGNDPQLMELFVSLCGNVMSDVNCEGKNKIVDRLWDVYEKQGYSINVNILNARLKSWSENEKMFDAREQLEDLELKRKLMPDKKFMTQLMSQLAKNGLRKELNDFSNEMTKRGFVPGKEYDQAMIRCASVCGLHDSADELITNYISKHGKHNGREAYGEAILGCAKQNYTDRIGSLLRNSIICPNKDNSTKFILNLSQETVMEAIWLLGNFGSSDSGKVNLDLCDQILEYSERKQGFFKLLVREAERHMHQQNYYTAVTLLRDTNRIKDALQHQNKTLFMNQLVTKLFNLMIRNRVSVGKMKEITNRLAASGGDNYRFYDFLAFSILTFKDFTDYQRFDTLTYFLNEIDPERERHHLIYPILADTKVANDCLSFLFRWVNEGYHDLTKLDIRILHQFILTPLFDQQIQKHPTESDYTRLENITKILKSYGISASISWNWLLEWKKLENKINSGHNFPCGKNNLSDWLRKSYNQTFNATSGVQIVQEDEESIKNKLQHFIKNKRFEEIRQLLDKDNIYKTVDISPYVDELLELFLQYGYWGQIVKLVDNIHNHCEPINGREDILTSVQLLKILKRYISDTKTDNVDEAIEFVYDLKRKFPHATVSKAVYLQNVYECRALIRNLIQRKQNFQLSGEYVQSAQTFLTTLYKLDIIELQTNEVVTPYFVSEVLNQIGWSEAVKVWLKFQSHLLCSNGLISLLKYALAYSDDRFQLYYVLHKAQTYMTQSKINAFYLAALVSVNRMSDAFAEVEKFKEPITSSDALYAFRLINSLGYTKSNEHFLKVYLQICLKHTDLVEKKDLMNLIVNDWISWFEHKNLGFRPLEFYDMFLKHGHQFDSRQTTRIWKLVNTTKLLIDKWILDEKGLLNVTRHNSEVPIWNRDLLESYEHLQKAVSQ
uniref:PPR_long domain-containing protein n=1 Tax=Rhabditophanes sp. KR3021 TaxID=114890 RepID=A0AC35UHA9_9BILA